MLSDQLLPAISPPAQVQTISPYKLQYHAHKGVKILEYRPRRGTEIYRVWNSARLNERQQKAWFLLTSDAEAARGNSGGVTAGYSGGVSDGGGERLHIPTAYENPAYRRHQALLASFSGTVMEKALLNDLIQDEVRVAALQQSAQVRLEVIGFRVSGYTSETTARVAGIAVIQCLFSRIADFYGI